MVKDFDMLCGVIKLGIFVFLFLFVDVEILVEEKIFFVSD